MTTPTLFTPLRMGALQLPNRVVMAPLTRNRADADTGAPVAMHAEYYGQRASAGLIIAEATQIAPEGKGYAWTPGIHSDAQIEGWRAVTDRVHAEGGRIVLQLWHVGRISHTSLQPDGQAPVAPSALRAEARVYDGTGFVETSMPRALETAEIGRVVADYRSAARNAQEAGFDVIEVHAANGYLIDQFLRDGANRRDDAYGGPVENRARLLVEVLEALTEVWEPGRIGIRFSPFSEANGITDSDPMATFTHAIRRASSFGLAYLHMVEGQLRESRDNGAGNDVATLRAAFDGAYIANNRYDRTLAIETVASGAADAIAFGRPFIANPDLPRRLLLDAALNPADEATFYGGGTEGYLDYPTLDTRRAA
jgi:N-ethylmaleimide reductase